MINLSVILPVHNQEDIIEPVLFAIERTIRSLRISFEIILVENGSGDDTGSVLRKLARGNPHRKITTSPKGYGNAVIRGLSIAKGMFVSYMPSDGQIDLSVLPLLWRLAKSGRYDVVKIKRITRESFIRTAVSRFFALVTAALFGIPALDINGSPRIFLRTKLTSLALSYGDSFVDAEFAVKAHRLGWSFHEIPMKTLPRYGGISTRSYRTFIEFIKNLWDFRTSNKLSDWQASVTSHQVKHTSYKNHGQSTH